MAMNENKNIWPFENLPEEVKTWLRSDSVVKITEELNTKFDFFGSAQKIIPFMVTWVVIGTIKPEEFIKTTMDEFQLPAKQSGELAEAVLGRILHPIKPVLRKVLHIDIDKITETAPGSTGPRATDMKIEDVPPRTVNLKQGPAKTNPEVASQPVAKPQSPSAENIRSDQPFHLTEQNPAPGPENQAPTSGV